jgi:hypothetical protein
MIDDEAAHHPRRVGHEPRPVGKRDAVPVRDLDVRLVQQRRHAERERAAAPGELAAGHPVQLRIKGGEQRLRRGRITALGGLEQRCERP